MDLKLSMYFSAIKKGGHLPNFWCAEEYFEKAGWQVLYESGADKVTLRVVDDAGQLMLPKMVAATGFVEREDCWARFSTLSPLGEFLDYEFIYDPREFLKLSGDKWRKVRKNLRWAEQDAGESFYFSTEAGSVEIGQFLEYWAQESEQADSWYDSEVFLKYMFEGKSRWFLRGSQTHKLYGIIATDRNFRYINFRYCVVQPKIRGLSDTARVKFYQLLAQSFWGDFLVNDGGTLGRDSLYNYKMKLNPRQVNKIFGGTLNGV